LIYRQTSDRELNKPFEGSFFMKKKTSDLQNNQYFSSTSLVNLPKPNRVVNIDLVSSIKRGILLKRAVFLKWWDTEFFNF
jgi:hypothetical protein